jgi:hypothetical protein
MAIDRVNPSGWTGTQPPLTRAQITQLDKNASYLLDSYANDILASDITFANASVMQFNNGVPFRIKDPSIVSIADGYCEVDCEFNGITKPEVTGYTSVTLPSTGTYTMPSSVYCNNTHIKLSGIILGDITVTLPADEGYEKFIEGSFVTFNQNSVTLTTGSGAEVVLKTGHKTLIYCCASGIFEVARTGHYKMVDEVYMHYDLDKSWYPYQPTPGALTPETTDPFYYGGNGKPARISDNVSLVKPGTIGKDHIGFTNLTTPGRAVFIDGKLGDKFEIFMSGGVKRTYGSGNVQSWIAPYVAYGPGWMWQSNVYYKPVEPVTYKILSSGMIAAENDDYYWGSSRTIFTAPITGTYEFKAFMYWLNATTSYTFPVIAYGPMVFHIKQWRL